ncbi:MAG: hypothetical protein N2491_01830 [Negativicutes bacterium]|nr:hypothetical protein [Negativicutes bacterium]
MVKQKEITFTCLGFKVNGIMCPLDQLPDSEAENIANAIVYALSKRAGKGVRECPAQQSSNSSLTILHLVP